MTVQPDGLIAQGEALPKFKRLGLPDVARHDTLLPVVTLDKWRHGWRIRHPQAVTTPRDNLHLFPRFSALCRGSIQFWGHGSGAKENAPTVPSLGVALSCGYPIRLGSKTPRIHPMIFTFLIAQSAGCVADLRRIRTISTVADTEAKARANLRGLPLVFMSRRPTGEASA